MVTLRAVAWALVMAMLITAPGAAASPPTGVTATTLWQRSAEGSDYVYREITIAPGGTTGWHWHPGRLYGIVKQGTLTHFHADCSVDGVYETGRGIFEPSGSDNVHVGRNVGAVPLVLQVLYILPAGAPLAQDAPNPGCSFA